MYCYTKDIPPLIESTNLSNLKSSSIEWKQMKEEMAFLKLEANYRFCKLTKNTRRVNYEDLFDDNDENECDDNSNVSENTSLLNKNEVSNSNLCGTTPMTTPIVINTEEAYQMYNLKQMTYGKKFVSNYKIKSMKFTDWISEPKPKHRNKKIKKGTPKDNAYLKAFENLPKIHRPVFEPPCPWLEKRLYIEDLCEPETMWEDVADAIRDNLNNLANDLCIFYTSQSHFLFTIIKVESYNCLRLLSLPVIQEYSVKITLSLLKNLLTLINQEMDEHFLSFSEMRSISKDFIFNYHRMPNPRAVSLRAKLKEQPRIVYFSMWLSDDKIPGIKNSKMDSRFVRLERMFFCKIILRRNLAALSTAAGASKINETLFEVYFDFNKGNFCLALANLETILVFKDPRQPLIKLNCYQCMVSCVFSDFFCCEEVSSLIEREYVMDDMSFHFINLMHWLKNQRMCHYVY